MPFEPTDRLSLGRTGLRVTRLGLGAASIGGLYEAVAEGDAQATVAHAWEIGIRTFDVAPLYGYGAAERRLGMALADHPRDEYVLSTKVGRLVRPPDAIPPGADVDAQSLDGRNDAYYARSEPLRLVFDYSADAVRRSMREEGTIRAVGAGMNQSSMLARFAREGDFDVFLVAGRYTLLDQDALTELLPLCVERGISILAAGVMNSGVLADPRPGSRFDYRPAPPAVVDRARRIAAVCERHDVPLRAAAIQFPLAHPAVVSLIAGVRSVDHLDEYPALMRRPIPAARWVNLRAEGLLAPGAPVPADNAEGTP